MDLIAEMYHTLTVQTNAGETLGAGGKDAYTTLLTTRCALRNGSGSRGLTFGVIEGSNDYRIITRYQDALWNAVSMSMKFIIDGVTYTMQRWEQMNNDRQRYIQFFVTSNPR